MFLDRIRSQSFASGISGVLSCGCERCRKAFLDRGVDIDAVRKLYEQKRDHFFDMAACPANGEFELAEEQAQRFFEAREKIIADAVNEISRQFKEKDLIVGLDLFAPFVSRIAGQNYSLITENADFIKPMLYRKTDAPAGIGYELSAFEKHVPAARGRMNFSMDRAFLNTQLQAASRVLCEKYPGIEINYDETVARTDSGYITESLKAIKDYAPEGVTLCWNIMQVPEAHIDAIAGLIETDDWIGLITERIRKALGDNNQKLAEKYADYMLRRIMANE